MGYNPLDMFGAGNTSDRNKAEGDLAQAQNAYKGATVPKLKDVHTNAVYTDPVSAQKAEAATTGPTAFGDIRTNPANNQAQQEQMAALSNLARNGGRSAASDANLARIQQNENANARGQRDAIMANQNARGMGGSGNDLLAQLTSSQNATNNQSANDMQVRGQDQNTALNAGSAAAGIGAGLHAQDYNEQAQKAQAQDAVSRFNAGNQQNTNVFNAGAANDMGRFNAGQNVQTQEFNSGQDMDAQRYNSGLGQTAFADDMAIRGGNQAGAKMGLDYWGKQAAAKQATKSNQIGSAIGMAGSLAGTAAGAYFGGPVGAAAGAQAGGALGGSIGKMAGGDDEDSSNMAAWGGRVPGMPRVPGDSYKNDTVNVTTSPGEVVVPRTLAKAGSAEQIHKFVKNPPQIGSGNDKEAMLGALKNLRKRR